MAQRPSVGESRLEYRERSWQVNDEMLTSSWLAWIACWKIPVLAERQQPLTAPSDEVPYEVQRQVD